mmetsp:Transcript_40432/g.47308  ORF Transcript_40432/g.47308 Transcript_40432/m.47308 type:complete len:187 (+) Transcript_40432:19-579(+)
MNMLNYYIDQKDYDSAMERNRTHPEEAKHSNKNGITALHWLVFDKAPLETVQAIYESYPGALHDVNKHGNTPLDIAIYRSSGEVIQFLIKSKEYQRITQTNIEVSHEFRKLRGEVDYLRRQKITLTEKLGTIQNSDHNQRIKTAAMQKSNEGKNHFIFDLDLLKMDENKENERLRLIKRINTAHAA